MELIEGCNLYTIDLTTRNDTDNTGFRKRHSEVTEQDILGAFDNILNKIRYQAKRHGWKYAIYGVSSNEHLSQHTKGAWHLHILLYGNPANTMCRKIKEYWVKARYGNSIQQEIKKCWSNGKQRYIIQQANTERFQHFGWTAQDLEIMTMGKRLTKKSFLDFSDLIGRLYAINGLANGTLEYTKGGWLKVLQCNACQINFESKSKENCGNENTETIGNSYFGELWQEMQRFKKA